MKMCVCGKGGSGKSTVVALLAEAFTKIGKDVLILDSDESNASLSWMLGFDHPPDPLMNLVGGKRYVQQKMLAGFTKGEAEPAMSIWELEKITSRTIPPENVAQKGRYALVATGKIHQALEGCACPMGVVTREFLRKLQLAPDEVALVDLEAGIEHFGRGIENSVDLVVCVVEPSLESISLAAKVMELTKAAGALFAGAIINKISTPEQEGIVASKLSELGIPVIVKLGLHEEIQRACLQGRPLEISLTSVEQQEITCFLDRCLKTS